MDYIASKTLMSDDSTVFLFEAEPEVLLSSVENAQPDDICIALTEYGFILQIKNVFFPIEDKMIRHIANTGVLVMMSATPQSYVMTPVYKITVPRELIYEARGALNFSRKAG